jgi:glycosyltransferase involved in cell wall biosynthesis
VRILFLAPQPFFQERGTPIAIDMMLSTLSDRGDEVDLLTFHLGEHRSYPGVRILRINPPLAPKYVLPGFSLKKVYCDLFLLQRSIAVMRAGCYDLIHAVEESVFVAMVLSSLFRVPYVYDMDSSLVTQMLHRFKWLRLLGRPMRALEALAMRRAMAVVPMCESLAESARQHCTGLVEVVSDASLIPTESDEVAEDLRALLGARGPIIMYVGNFERYQGVDLLLDAFALVHESHSDAELVIICGTLPTIDRFQQQARATPAGNRVHFLGTRPLAALGSFLKQADLLVSPRSEGDNTPLKLYSYLDSGVAVVATDVPAHTQVATTAEVAFSPVDAGAMAATICRLLDDPLERRQLACNARALIARAHTQEVFSRTVNRLFGELEQRVIGGH